MSPDPAYEISVIVPSYERRELLRRCLDSLAVQTLDPERFEVVVIDDGSSDGTAAMVGELSTPYALRLLPAAPRQSEARDFGRAARARNAAAEASRGRVCLHVDDDIVCSPRLLADHVAAHDGRDRVVGIGKLVQAPPDADDWYAHSFAQGLGEHYEELLHRKPIWTDCYGANFSTTRAVYLELGGLDPELRSAYDLEFGYRAREAGCSFEYLPDAEGIHDDQKLSKRMLEDARVAAEAHVQVVARHPGTEATMLDWAGPAGPLELRLRRIAIALRIPPAALAFLGRFLPSTGRKMIWLHFVRRYAFWLSVSRNVDSARWHELTGESGRPRREAGAPQSVP
jgi:GT2 family glycosyltransferase